MPLPESRYKWDYMLKLILWILFNREREKERAKEIEKEGEGAWRERGQRERERQRENITTVRIPVMSHWSSSSGLLGGDCVEHRVQWINICLVQVGMARYLLWVGHEFYTVSCTRCWIGWIPLQHVQSSLNQSSGARCQEFQLE